MLFVVLHCKPAIFFSTMVPWRGCVLTVFITLVFNPSTICAHNNDKTSLNNNFVRAVELKQLTLAFFSRTKFQNLQQRMRLAPNHIS